MAGFSRDEWIDASPETVFDFMNAPENAPQIMENVVSYELITDGELGVGSRFRETRMVRGRKAMAELEVTAFDRPTLYASTFDDRGIRATYTYRLSAENGGTNIHLLAEVTGRGLKKLLVPIVVSFMKKEDGDHLTRLKNAIENK